DYYVFDIIMYNGIIVDKKYFERIALFRGVKLPTIRNMLVHNTETNNKKFFFAFGKKKFFHTIRQALLDMDTRDNDGLIFTPFSSYYDEKNAIKKWKPEDKLTIDFLIKKKLLYVMKDD